MTNPTQLTHIRWIPQYTSGPTLYRAECAELPGISIYTECYSSWDGRHYMWHARTWQHWESQQYYDVSDLKQAVQEYCDFVYAQYLAKRNAEDENTIPSKPVPEIDIEKSIPCYPSNMLRRVSGGWVCDPSLLSRNEAVKEQATT